MISRIKNEAFTLIELLVVIAIIGLLASVVLVSLNNARVKARDTKRKTDLRQIAQAMELYYQSGNNTYIIPGSGSGGCGCGWFNYEAGAYVKSNARALQETGLMSKVPRDPSLTSNNQTPQYMKYQCGSGFYIYAKLESPSAEDLASYTASKAGGCVNLDAYGMNYAIGHR